jgi:hypothetical protein
MKTKTPFVLLALATLASLSPIIAQDAGKQPPAQKKKAGPNRASPHETTYARIGPDRQNSSLISITYGRPYSARGGKGEPRKIWGSLVPWDKADRLGADEATLIVLQDPIEIGGKTIPAGAHTLYIVPSETGTSQLAFSSAIGKWGIPVDETKDIARVPLKKDTLPEAVEQLTIAVENQPPGGVLKIMWETTQFSVPFTVKKKA